MTSLEICAGAGGQAIGLEQAGFKHVALVDNDHFACETLRANRKKWNVIEKDLAEFSAKPYKGVDIFTGGLPCPPFSIAGKQLGHADERNLFPIAFELISQCKPKAVMIENVKGILEPDFKPYRNWIDRQFKKLGFKPVWKLLNASDFGTPQLRPRVVIIALKSRFARKFSWPTPNEIQPPTVGERLLNLMSSRGWPHAQEWATYANKIAPTVVGGSKKNGGPDLGPTRAKKAWAELHVDGHGIANEPPAPNFVGFPKLTVPMVALLQGFPDDWKFAGKKTASYRQVGNAFPPPLARAVAIKLREALTPR
jgi:DNA (cytosine-5)-methyltransferase 1